VSDDENKSGDKERSFEDFSARLQAARQAQKDKSSGKPKPMSAYGAAIRLVADLVAGIVMGALIGLFLDDWLGTRPWLMIVFLFLGIGAGIRNVLRTAEQMNRPGSDDEEDKP
tara:strand:- start:8141 stop:8479 length:339 start_codon:yes stop_codon:yes gene_type:complete